MPGLAPNTNLRLVPDPEPGMPPPANIEVHVDAGEDAPVIDDNDNVVRIEHADGSITVSLDGKPLNEPKPEKPIEWFDNLADKIDAAELSRITDDLLRGVEEDLTSRQDWIDDRAQGIKLLGLKIELPNVQGAADGAPVEGMSKVRHPLLLEAVVRFNANARSEFLPTDGPVKIRNDSTSANVLSDELASALEMDMNHYLTTRASEYYPDTDRMLLMAGFGGDGFKKVYKCPLRNRAVSESVDAEDLIVNQSATDLTNAQRVTHRSMMKPSTVRRMQILGIYRDISLTDAKAPTTDALEDEKRAQQGISVNTTGRPQDREREIYEIYCELDIVGFEHKHHGKDSGLAVPYVVTIDTSSRETLSVVRNYGKDDAPLPVARKRFVKWPFIPGLGFYDIGLLHILGNTTNAVTAAWREMLDCGMFANFPGYLMADNGGRQNTNIFRVPPGGGASVKTNGVPIKDAVMPLPYSTQGMAALMQLVENMAETGRRIGGTAEVQVGEGRADVPVGTVMAMIDQAIKVMNAVHKRMHSAQAEEFQLLKQVIKENPETFFESGCKSKTTWDKQKFLMAIDNCSLVPQADPNTSSAGQRMMKIMGLMQLQDKAPALYDPIKIHTAALAAMGWSNPEEFFVPPSARAQPPPQLLQMQREMDDKTKVADAKVATSQAQAKVAEARADEVNAKIAMGHFEPKHEGASAPESKETSLDVATAQAKIMDAHTRRADVGLKARELVVNDQNRDQDREARQEDAAIGLAKEVIQEPKDAASAGKRAVGIMGQIGKWIGRRE